MTSTSIHSTPRVVPHDHGSCQPVPRHGYTVSKYNCTCICICGSHQSNISAECICRMFIIIIILNDQCAFASTTNNSSASRNSRGKVNRCNLQPC